VSDAGVAAQFVWYPFEDYGYSRNYRGYGWGGYNYQMYGRSASGTKHYEYIVEGAYLASNGTTFKEATKYINGLYWLNRDAANKVTIKNWKLYEIK
jgi:hypothetical protein